jgi:hypothetical protein
MSLQKPLHLADLCLQACYRSQRNPQGQILTAVESVSEAFPGS